MSQLDLFATDAEASAAPATRIPATPDPVAVQGALFAPSATWLRDPHRKPAPVALDPALHGDTLPVGGGEGGSATDGEDVCPITPSPPSVPCSPEEPAMITSTATSADLTEDQIRADALRWAANRIDPGPAATRRKPLDLLDDHVMVADRGTAARLRFMADQIERGYITATVLPIEQRIA